MASAADAGSSGERNEFSLGWKTLLAGVLGVACGASPIPYNVIGFTAEPLTAEFGWSQTQILVPITIFGVIASFLAPVFGWMADRFGVRPVALWSLFAFALAFAAISLTPASNDPSTLYIYYGFWVVVGLVGIGSTPVTWSRAINLWFFKNRGLALGILLMGTSLAAMVVPQIAVWAIENFGWRRMFLVIGCLPIVALIVGYFLFREPRPEERPKAIESASGNLTGVQLGTALKDYRFWLIWLSIALIASIPGVDIHCGYLHHGLGDARPRRFAPQADVASVAVNKDDGAALVEIAKTGGRVTIFTHMKKDGSPQNFPRS